MANNYKSNLKCSFDSTTHLYASSALFSTDSDLLLKALSNKPNVLFFYDESSEGHFSQIHHYLNHLKNNAQIGEFEIRCFPQQTVHDSGVAFDATIKDIKTAGLMRKDVVIVFGEEDTNDFVNFTAAMYRRGLKCVRIYHNEAAGIKATEKGRHTSVPIPGFKSDELRVWSSSCSAVNHVFVCEDNANQNLGVSPEHPLRTHRQTSRSEFTIKYQNDLFNSASNEFIAELNSRKSVVVVFDPFQGFELNQLKQFFNTQVCHGVIDDYHLIPLKVTEHNKNIQTCIKLIETLDLLGVYDDDLVVVLGGGAIMDVVGYTASLYCEFGLDYIRVPTTLLGMIDAGVGLKVGVNYGGSKNFIGDYYPPLASFVDVQFLDTLPQAEISCGLSEAIKIAAVKSKSLYDQIGDHFHCFFSCKMTPAVDHIMRHAIALMLEELEANPLEYDLRRLPDFGHEFGHVVESISDYRLRHGEAVAIGMVISTHIAMQKGLISFNEYRQFTTLLRDMSLPVFDSCCQAEILWEHTLKDILPHKAGKLYLVVPEGLGCGGFIDEVEEVSLLMLLNACEDLLTLDTQFKTADDGMRTATNNFLKALSPSNV